MIIIFSTDQIYLHGGIEKVMATKANYFASLPNVQVIILTTGQRNYKPCYNLAPSIKLLDLGINYNVKKSYFSFENLKKAILHFIKQRKILNEIIPDVVISPNYSFDHYWLPFLCKGINLIKERHNSRYNKITSFFRYKIDNYIDRKYNHIVVLNDDELGYVHSNNGIVIPNPTAKSRLIAKLDNKRVIAAGRISPIKRFDLLIDCWYLIHSKFPDWKLDIYGQDYLETKKELVEKIQFYRLESAVTIHEGVSNLLEIMNESSIYVMTSETECFPMVLLEAQSIGLPVISFDVPTGPRNIIINKENGILVPFGDIQSMANEIMYLIENNDLRKKMGYMAKVHSRKFTTECVMKQWKNLLGI